MNLNYLSYKSKKKKTIKKAADLNHNSKLDNNKCYYLVKKFKKILGLLKLIHKKNFSLAR